MPNLEIESAQLLEDAWKNGVREDYIKGLLHHENNLQSSLYYHLRNKSSDDRVFTESLHREEDLEGRIPDMIICSPDGRHIDFILELKFRPWWGIVKKDYDSDIEKLIWLAQNSKDKDFKVSVRLNPYSGDSDQEKYRITNRTQYAFVIVGKGDDKAAKAIEEAFIEKAQDETIIQRMWLLWAWADGGKHPDFLVKHLATCIGGR